MAPVTSLKLPVASACGSRVIAELAGGLVEQHA
jgi:hypothetical protein